MPGPYLDQAVLAASAGSHCPTPEAGKVLGDHWSKIKTSFTKLLHFKADKKTSGLTVVLGVPGYKARGCMDPWEHRGAPEGLEDHVGLALHVDQGAHVAHPLEWRVPDERIEIQ